MNGLTCLKDVLEGYGTFADNAVLLRLAQALGPADAMNICERAPSRQQHQWPELFFQVFWNEQRLRPPLHTADGRRLEVVHPGNWNVAAGPDFTGARLRLDGAELSGDVEVHRCQQDWAGHGHGADPAYAGVVLHVVWELRPGETVPLPGAPSAVFELSAHLRRPWRTLVDEVRAAAYPYARRIAPGECALGLARMENAELARVLEQAGLARFSEKAERLFRAGAVRGFDQALYEAVFEGLGFKMNREPLRRLAELAPLAELRRRPERETREAVLLGLAGFLPDPTRTPVPAAARPAVQRWWNEWWKTGLRAADGLEWTRAMQRPCNRPERRLRAGLAWLRACDCQPVRWMLRLLAESGGSPRGMCARLAEGFRAAAVTVRTEPALAAAAALGDARIRDLLANAVLPLAFALARQEGDAARAQAVLAAFREMPRLQTNRCLEEGVHRLLVPPSRLRDVARRAVHQQGIMQIHRDFCGRFAGTCGNCPFRQGGEVEG